MGRGGIMYQSLCQFERQVQALGLGLGLHSGDGIYRGTTAPFLNVIFHSSFCFSFRVEYEMRQLRTQLLCYIRSETFLFVCLPYPSPHMTQNSQLILVTMFKDQSTEEEKKKKRKKSSHRKKTSN